MCAKCDKMFKEVQRKAKYGQPLNREEKEFIAAYLRADTAARELLEALLREGDAVVAADGKVELSPWVEERLAAGWPWAMDEEEID
jgi:hypothetical protein